MSNQDLKALKDQNESLLKKFESFKSRNLALDMTRGKPCPKQLDLALPMLTNVSETSYKAANGTDCRNYGGLDGIPEAKALFSQYLEVNEDEIVIGGNSSLNLMHDTMVNAMVYGVYDSEKPWGKLPKVKFLCPSPGYDRHFAICETLGIEMIVVGMNENGPDMDQVEKLVAEDDAIKGIWCVPKYSNPTGITYSDETVLRLASMKTKASDFRIFYDNAYSYHHLTDERPELSNILEKCKESGNPNRVFIFGSTSKITFAGGGLSMIGSSKTNIDYIKSKIAFQTIGPDKINQLRHVRFFGDLAGVENHMVKHAEILKPKFDKVNEVLERELSGLSIATWSDPKGGYFVDLDTLDGCATRVIALADEAGVKLTPAGSTYPLKKDPSDKNIRIAPSLPEVDELELAMEVLSLCIKLASIELA